MEDNKTKDLMVELNVIEAPMFTFTRKNQTFKVKDLMETDSTTNDAKKVLKGIYKKDENTKVEYRQWTDSKGKTRELVVASVRETPKALAMDVFFALIKKLMAANYPVDFDKDGNIHIKDNQVNFTTYELCKIMGKTPSSELYEDIREAILQLKSVEYYSVGALYNKSKNLYEDGAVKGVNLVDEMYTSQKNLENKIISGYVKFSDLVMDNLRAGYVRMLRNDLYFHLRSGITRSLYIYVENNRDSIYTKRGFSVISDKIPIPYKYISDFKKKLSPALNNLVKAGVIVDFMYGDEFLINGIKENSVYFIFNGTKKSLIKYLEDEYKKKHPKLSDKDHKKNNLEDDYELIFPEDIEKELRDIGVNTKKIAEIMKKYSKYKIAEYILWIKDGVNKGKVNDPPGLFVFAITDEMVKVRSSHPHIVEFIEKIKSEVEGKKIIDVKLINQAYTDYINAELELFKTENEFIYTSLRDTVLDEIELVQAKRIKSQRTLYNMATTENEKEKLMMVIERWEKFSIEREKSEIFIEQFAKKIKLLKGLKDYEEFKGEYLEKNK